MSQYIPGVVDYVPQIQPYKPNLNFYQQVLETKNAQYQQGYDKLSSLYGNLLESPMLRDENIDLRNKFFNDIGAQISKISGLDLSLSQNVDAASKIFQPLTDNKYILKDMAYTKRAYNELQRGENFRNCTDEKKCGGKYWDGGIRAIQYQMADFAKSTADESLGFDAPKFTPYVNVPEKAMKFAKEMGFETTPPPTMSPDGRFLVTTTNGVTMIPSLTSAFLSVFQNDQSAVDYYRTQAYLERKDFIAQNAEKYGSDVDAERYYLTEMGQSLFADNDAKAKQAAQEADEADLKSKVVDQQIKSRGIDPNNKNDQKLAATHKQTQVDKLIAIASQEYYDNTKNEADPQTLVGSDIITERSRIDNAMANSMFSGDLYNAAASYAMLTAKTDIEVNQYALAGFEHSLALDRMDKQFILDMEKAKRTAALDILKDNYKSNKEKDALGKSNDVLSNEWIPEVIANGGKSTIARDPNLQGTDQNEQYIFGSGVQQTSKALMQEVYSRLETIIKTDIGKTVGNGIIVTKETKEQAQQYKAKLLGWSWKNEQKSNKSSSYVSPEDKAMNLLTVVPNVASALYKGLFGDKESVEAPTTYNGGYLDENGKLIEIDKSTSFTDGNNKNNWYYTTKNIEKALETDPVLLNMIGVDKTLIGKVNVHKNAVQNYNAAEEILGFNVEGVKGVVDRNYMNSIINSVVASSHQEYAQEILKNNFVKNNRVVSKEEFIKDYENNWSPTRRSIGENFLLDAAPFGFLFSDRYESDKTEAAALYDAYSETFSSVYNQEDGFNTFADQKSLKYGHVKTVGGAGAYVEKQPITIPLVDSAYPGDLGAQHFMGFMKDFESVMRTDANLFVINKDGKEIDADALSDLTGFTDGLSDRVDSRSVEALNKIANDLRSGKKITDEDRARFSFTVHPNIGGDLSKVGFTVRLNSEFRGKNQGGENTYGSTKGLTSDAITVVMDKSDMSPNNEAYQQTQRTQYDLLMEAYDEINITGYEEYGGTAQIKRNPYGPGYEIKRSYKYFDDNGNLMTYEPSPDYSDPNATAGLVAQTAIQSLEKVYTDVKSTADALRQINPNIIKDPSQLR